MRLIVNGHEMSHRQNKKRMLTGGWDRARIPAGYLVDGPNEFVFAESGVLHADPKPGGASSRSFDGGKTWHVGALGPGHEVEGEYMVRLRLRGYPPKGQLTSPVIDLFGADGDGCIAPRAEIKKLRLASRGRTAPGTRIQFEMRCGSRPSADPRWWSPWQARKTLSRPGRFVQWRATLKTNSADKTPVLRRVTLEVDVGKDAGGMGDIKLLELDQPKLARCSYEFTCLAPHARLTRLVKQYRLEDVIAPGRTELEKFALLRDWVHSQWLGWQGKTYPHCPPWDPIEILETTKGNWGFGMCTHYAAVFVGCAAALGFVARVLIIDHHCLTEIWSEELQKWILQDPGPSREHDATYELEGVPLSALEVHDALARGEADKIMASKLPLGKTEKMGNVADIFCRFGIPLRNNHLTQAEPAEQRHGAGQYHWDGYLWWSDGIDPKYAEYSLQTSRPADFYWSVNQTRIYLQAGEKPDTLAVDFQTVTPNFSHCLVRIDDCEWTKQCAPFQWPLHAGENALAVRAVNVFGREGRISRAVVRCGK